MRTTYFFSVRYPAAKYSFEMDQTIVKAMKKVRAMETDSGMGFGFRDIGFECGSLQALADGINLAKELKLKIDTDYVGYFYGHDDELTVYFHPNTGLITIVCLWQE
jgi:hypothetical protein